jgi:broad specificity phosphatase PhoE
VSVILLRHCEAGNTADLSPVENEQQPLTADGELMAQKLSSVLKSYNPTKVVTSPFERCKETVAPLNLPTSVDPKLHEGAGVLGISDIEKLAGTNTVVCTHGDVIKSVIQSLKNSGVDVHGALKAEKGSFWVLDGANDKYTSAT